jgi:hypothetical protein
MTNEQPLKIYENTPDGDFRATENGWVKTDKSNSELRGYRKKR